MTDQIKVSEVSAILRQQLEGISTGIRTEEVGTVLQVSDGVARIYGLDNAEANELLQTSASIFPTDILPTDISMPASMIPLPGSASHSTMLTLCTHGRSRQTKRRSKNLSTEIVSTGSRLAV